MNDKHSVHKRWLPTLAFAGFAIGIVTIALTGGELRYSDEREYLEIAGSLAAGEGFRLDGQPTAFRPPTWPGLLAVAMSLGLPPVALPAISAACLVGAALLARGVAKNIAGEPAGWMAAFGVLLYPLNVYTATTLYPQALAMLLLLFPLYLLSTRFETRTPPHWVLAVTGLSCALLVLAVPTMAMTASAIIAATLWRWRSHWLRVVVVAGIAAILPVTAWTARNYSEFDELVPVSTATGVNLLLGNSENSTVSSGAGADIERYTDEAAARQLTETARNDYFTAKALAWVKDHPLETASLYGAKFLNYFSPYNAPHTAEAGTRQAAFLAWVTYAPLLAIALARLLGARVLGPLRSPEQLMWVLFAGNALFMAVTFTRTRFRQPLDALLVIEAAVVIGLLISAWLQAHRSPRPTGAAPGTRPA